MLKRKSVTLLELIIILVVFALVMPPFLISLNTSTLKLAQAEVMTTSVIVGRSLLEEIISKGFDANTTNPWTPILDFGDDNEGGPTNREDFDDIDDYHGFTENVGNGFTRTANIYYVDPSINLDTSQSHVTDYKRVDVTVSHNLMGDTHFAFIMSSEY